MTQYHNPVLLKETLQGLKIQPQGVYIDVTYGGGGHSRGIIDKLNDKGRLYGFDQDADAYKNRIDDFRFELIAANFSHLKQYLKYYSVIEVDGILADFGVSSHQFDAPQRGFSIRFDAPLDMRMNQDNSLSAQTIINNYEQDDLRCLFKDYGELRSAPALARTIVAGRREAPIETTFQLKSLLSRHLPQGKQNKILAQIYQAIRIEVNNELEVLKSFLMDARAVLKPGGRLSVISYHSLEDRLVKRFIRNGLFEGEPARDIFGNFEVPFKKIGKLIVPSEQEIKMNNRARSAKLRIAQKL